MCVCARAHTRVCVYTLLVAILVLLFKFLYAGLVLQTITKHKSTRKIGVKFHTSSYNVP